MLGLLADAHQHRVRFDDLFAPRSPHGDRDAVAPPCHGGDLGVEQDPVPSRGEFGEPRRHLLVLGHQQPLPVLHDRDVRPERVEDVAELGRDEPSADDDQGRGHLVDPHDGVRGVVGHGVEPGDVGDHRARPDRHDDRLPADLLGADLQHLRRDEAGRFGVHVDAAVPAEAHRAFVERVDPPEHPVADGPPLHGFHRRADAEPCGLPRLHHRVGGDDQHLAGDAAPVEARPAEPSWVDGRGAQMGEFVAEQHVAAAHSQNHEVVVLHVRPPSVPDESVSSRF